MLTLPVGVPLGPSITTLKQVMGRW